jgi:hypothetical protein
MSPVTVRGAAQITGIAPQFLVDDLDRPQCRKCGQGDMVKLVGAHCHRILVRVSPL